MLYAIFNDTLEQFVMIVFEYYQDSTVMFISEGLLRTEMLMRRVLLSESSGSYS